MQNSFYNQSSSFITAVTCYKNYRFKNAFAFLFVFIAVNVNSIAQTDSWVQKSDLGYDTMNVAEPTPSWSAVDFSIGSKGYIQVPGAKDFWEFDPVANTWIQKADFGGAPRGGAVGFNIGSRGYIGTGSSGGYPVTYYNDFWEYDPSANTWIQKADFGGTERGGAVAFSIGTKGYLGTGGNAPLVSFKDFWEYDPTANKWTRKADFEGTARGNAVGFSIGNKGYLGTGAFSYGWGTSYTRDFWEYDPSANIWTQKADFGGTARLGAVGFSIGSKGHLGTGWSEKGIHEKDFWEYDPSANTWIQKADFGGTGREGAVGFSIGSKGYLGTGYFYTNYNGYIARDFWEYDPYVNNWTQKADFGGTKRGGATGFSIGTKGYIGMGYTVSGYTNDFWEYDPLSNTWTQKADYSGVARSGAVGFSIGTKGYLGTGYNPIDPGIFFKDFWEYDPAANKWTRKADFEGTARGNAVGFSIGNKGYLGTGSFNENDFWEYNPVSDVWVRKADFGGQTRIWAVGFSIGSKGYIGMGSDLHRVKNDFWEYDPASNAWTKKANFGGIARYKAVGFSIDSKGYIGTGSDMKDFWEYDPAANTWTRKADFGGEPRSGATGFSIGNKGYLGTGSYYKNDFWEYTPGSTHGGCPNPTNIRVAKISDTCARLKWNIPPASVEHIKISYRKLGESTWNEERKKTGEPSIKICGLTPNTTYEWKVRNICADTNTIWVHGPNFTTAGVLPLQLISFTAALQKNNAILNWQTGNEINTAYFEIQRSYNGSSFNNIAKQNATGYGIAQDYVYSDANVIALQQPTLFYRLQMVDNDGSYTYSNIIQLKVNNTNGVFVAIYPNPNKGSFTLQMQLSSKAASTKIVLFNNLGERVWSQDAGKLSGFISRNITLENKLTAGVYVLQVQHGEQRLMQKVVMVK